MIVMIKEIIHVVMIGSAYMIIVMDVLVMIEIDRKYYERPHDKRDTGDADSNLRSSEYNSRYDDRGQGSNNRRRGKDYHVRKRTRR